MYVGITCRAGQGEATYKLPRNTLQPQLHLL